MTAFIYLVRNIINGKIYIGKCLASPEKRWIRHVRESKNPKNRFHSAIKKYGKDNFKLEIVETTHIPNERETFWIQKMDSKNPDIGYNMRDGGDGGDMSHSPKFQQAMKNRDYSGSRNPNFGKVSAMRGKHYSLEFAQKISKKAQERWSKKNKEERIAFGEKVSGSKNGMFGKKPPPILPVLILGITYPSKAAAKRSLGIKEAELKKLLETK